MQNTLLSAWKNAKFETTMLGVNALAVGLNVVSFIMNGPGIMGLLNACAAGVCTAGAVVYYQDLKHKINNAPSPN